MKSGGRKKVMVFLLGMVLLTLIRPAWPQAPGVFKALPEILEFDRKLCPVCREAELIIREILNQYPGQFAVRKIYIDEQGPMFRGYRVAFVPTQVFLDASGQEVFRHEGVFAKGKLLQKLLDLKFIKDGQK